LGINKTAIKQETKMGYSEDIRVKITASNRQFAEAFAKGFQ